MRIRIKKSQVPSAINLFKDIEEQMGGKEIIVFLDYDGTLTPIVSRPEDAVLSSGMRNTLKRLARQCTTAIISGRGLADIKSRSNIEGFYYAGSHGFEIEGPDNLTLEQEKAKKCIAAVDNAEKKLKRNLFGIPGVQLERKKYSIAVHYRNAEKKDVGKVKRAVDDVVKKQSKLRKTSGKKVYELLPAVSWDKGKALLWILKKLNLNRPNVLAVYIGDDTTDEDAFNVLTTRGIGIVVTKDPRKTAAKYKLKDTAEVRSFLDKLSAIMKENANWELVYKGFEPKKEGLREALCTLGNGYFATRGASPQCRADGIHYPGTYLAGGYNRLETVIAGRTVENEALVNLPNWLYINFRCRGEKWFNLKDAKVLSYLQKLDTKQGLLYRKIHFRDRKKRETLFIQRRIVSMANMHLAGLEVTVVPVNWSGKIEICSSLDGQVNNSGVDRYKQLNNQHLEFVEGNTKGKNIIFLKMRTNQSRLEIAQTARTEIFEENKLVSGKVRIEKNASRISQYITLDLKEGTGITIEKVVSLFASRDQAVSECDTEAVLAVVVAGRFEALLKPHILAWKHLWERFDIQLEIADTDKIDYMQRTLRLYIFHLLQTTSLHSLDVDAGVPSRGWHGEAYRGHIFWDELFIFPLLNYRFPQITRTLLMYRYRRLKEARRTAKNLGYKGAVYPWQSGSNGREETQKLHLNPKSHKWIPDNSHLQRHINAAIVYNIWQYYQVTGDLDFLAFYGAEIIFEIARFWASIANFNEKLKRYEVKKVMGPDEFHDAYPDAKYPGLNNNAYTNIMVVFVLNRALELFKLLNQQQIRQLCEKLAIEPSEIKKWEEISRKMRIVFHEGEIISQFEGYSELREFNWAGYRKRYGNIQRLDRILGAEDDSVNNYKASKQADVLMLFYLFSTEELRQMFNQLGYSFDPNLISQNINYYLSRTSNGSSLSRIIHSWVATRQDRARSFRLFEEALKTDVADIQGGTTPEGIHLGAMSGCVDIIQRCYTGLEARNYVLKFDPHFPQELRRIKMNIRYQGHWLQVDITSRKIKIKALACGVKPIQIEVKGNCFKLREGQKRVIQL
jgi:alpha,alpha-trehalase